MQSIVLFSGGLDSLAALALARESSDVLALVYFEYGQLHARAEREAVDRLSIGTTTYIMSVPALSDIAMDGDIFPSRNPVFLALAAGVASARKATQVWAGFCWDDVAGFPDCRPAFIGAQQTALRLALDLPAFEIVTPLLYRSKVETFALLESRRLLDVARHTHTCYKGSRDEHDWGHGCGNCSACMTRANGWKEFTNARTSG